MYKSRTVNGEREMCVFVSPQLRVDKPERVKTRDKTERLQVRTGEQESLRHFVHKLKHPDLRGDERLKLLKSLNSSLNSRPVR